MIDVTIRRADWNDPADCAAVIGLLDAYSREPIEGGNPLSPYAREHVVDGLRHVPGACVLLAFAGQQAVGIAVCFRGFSTFAARPLMNLHDLAVLPELRGQGIGGRLLDAVCDHARQASCCKLTLEVRAENTAADRLYRRHGFGDPAGKSSRFLDKPL
jgi:ribosomal protein S18 acetylase RimI-like enzyme